MGVLGRRAEITPRANYLDDGVISNHGDLFHRS